MAPKSDRFDTASKDFDRALQQAQAALDAATSPSIKNLVLALASYSRAITETIIAVSDQLEDVNRNVRNVAARLDGKKGPFDLKMRK